MNQFLKSLELHQIKLCGGFAQRVMLEKSDNPYFHYPVLGVVVILEQGIDLSIISAIFHKEKADGSLGAPAVIKNAKYHSI